MLINGKPAASTVPQILEQLAALPSSFPNYISNLGIQHLNYQEVKIYNNTVNLFYEGYNLSKEGKYHEALKRLDAAEKMAQTQPNNVLLPKINTVIARNYHNLGMFDNAAKKYQDSIDQFLDTKQYYDIENLCKEIAVLHKNQGTINQYTKEQETILQHSKSNNDQGLELKARLALGAAHRMQNNYEESINQYANAYSLQQGKVDYKAKRVEQHEVGFSNKEKIGTDNIQQCVAVIIHDPISKKTALAHVDRLTNVESLTTNVVNKFPSGTSLEAYLIGGRDRSPQSLAVSNTNIKKVTEELAKHKFININSADIGDKGAPSGIVFDPITGKLEHAVPGNEDKTTALRHVNLFFMQDNSNLYTAFDLTQTKNIPFPVLSQAQQQEVVYHALQPQLMQHSTSAETWHANQILLPYAKAAEVIKQNNPKLVADILKENISTKIQKLDLPPQVKERLTNDLVRKTNLLMSNKANSLSAISKELNKSLSTSKQDNSIKKPWVQKIREQFVKFISGIFRSENPATTTLSSSETDKILHTKNVTLMKTTKTTIKSPTPTPIMISKQNNRGKSNENRSQATRL